MYNQNYERDKEGNDHKPDTSPKPEIQIPSTTPLSNPPKTPGIDRTNPTPEYDTTDLPESNPIPLVFPEVDPDSRPAINEDSPPTASNRIGFY